MFVAGRHMGFGAAHARRVESRRDESSGGRLGGLGYAEIPSSRGRYVSWGFWMAMTKGCKGQGTLRRAVEEGW